MLQQHRKVHEQSFLLIKATAIKDGGIEKRKKAVSANHHVRMQLRTYNLNSLRVFSHYLH